MQPGHFINRANDARSDGKGPFVHLVEHDGEARAGTARLLTAAGHSVRSYASAADFLARVPIAHPGCVVLDLLLPDGHGFDLQATLAHADLPFIFVSGHADVPMTVRAIKAGAVDFLVKPVAHDLLLDAVAQALECNAEKRATRARLEEIRRRYEQLTPREREVFRHLIAGQLNKQVAYDLGTAERTIKAHRHSIMGKLQAGSIVELVRLAAMLEITPQAGS